MPEQYDRTNTITIWFKKPEHHDLAPDIKVEINDGGKETEYALWKRKDSDNPRGPAYRGKVEHDKSSKAGYEKNATPSPDDFTDEQVPF